MKLVDIWSSSLNHSLEASSFMLFIFGDEYF